MENKVYGSRNSTIAIRLREVMNEKGLKQVDIVNATGLSKGDVSHYLKGDYSPKSDKIEVLARYLDVSEAWLWGFDAPKERSRSQKKNDQIADLVIRMEKDELFFDAVTKLNSLSVEGLKAYITLMGLQEQPKD